ncbi:MAG: uncharacterized protein A8A55_0657 [Amphiamblys sp. WSBS2006]|nr:MAG: uncharacterized protein A8A55_0657 [Amphiamblys sp. WSBS2006]
MHPIKKYFPFVAIGFFFLSIPAVYQLYKNRNIKPTVTAVFLDCSDRLCLRAEFEVETPLSVEILAANVCVMIEDTPLLTLTEKDFSVKKEKTRYTVTIQKTIGSVFTGKTQIEKNTAVSVSLSVRAKITFFLGQIVVRKSKRIENIRNTETNTEIRTSGKKHSLNVKTSLEDTALRNIHNVDLNIPDMCFLIADKENTKLARIQIQRQKITKENLSLKFLVCLEKTNRRPALCYLSISEETHTVFSPAASILVSADRLLPRTQNVGKKDHGSLAATIHENEAQILLAMNINTKAAFFDIPGIEVQTEGNALIGLISCHAGTNGISLRMGLDKAALRTIDKKTKVFLRPVETETLLDYVHLTLGCSCPATLHIGECKMEVPLITDPAKACSYNIDIKEDRNTLTVIARRLDCSPSESPPHEASDHSLAFTKELAQNLLSFSENKKQASEISVDFNIAKNTLQIFPVGVVSIEQTLPFSAVLSVEVLLQTPFKTKLCRIEKMFLIPGKKNTEVHFIENKTRIQIESPKTHTDPPAPDRKETPKRKIAIAIEIYPSGDSITARLHTKKTKTDRKTLSLRNKKMKLKKGGMEMDVLVTEAKIPISAPSEAFFSLTLSLHTEDMASFSPKLFADSELEITCGDTLAVSLPGTYSPDSVELHIQPHDSLTTHIPSAFPYHISERWGEELDTEKIKHPAVENTLYTLTLGNSLENILRENSMLALKELDMDGNVEMDFSVQIKKTTLFCGLNGINIFSVTTQKEGEKALRIELGLTDAYKEIRRVLYPVLIQSLHSREVLALDQTPTRTLHHAATTVTACGHDENTFAGKVLNSFTKKIECPPIGTVPADTGANSGIDLAGKTGKEFLFTYKLELPSLIKKIIKTRLSAHGNVFYRKKKIFKVNYVAEKDLLEINLLLENKEELMKVISIKSGMYEEEAELLLEGEVFGKRLRTEMTLKGKRGRRNMLERVDLNLRENIPRLFVGVGRYVKDRVKERIFKTAADTPALSQTYCLKIKKRYNWTILFKELSATITAFEGDRKIELLVDTAEMGEDIFMRGQYPPGVLLSVIYNGWATGDLIPHYLKIDGSCTLVFETEKTKEVELRIPIKLAKYKINPPDLLERYPALQKTGIIERLLLEPFKKPGIEKTDGNKKHLGKNDSMVVVVKRNDVFGLYLGGELFLFLKDGYLRTGTNACLGKLEGDAHLTLDTARNIATLEIENKKHRREFPLGSYSDADGGFDVGITTETESFLGVHEIDFETSFVLVDSSAPAKTNTENTFYVQLGNENKTIVNRKLDVLLLPMSSDAGERKILSVGYEKEINAAKVQYSCEREGRYHIGVALDGREVWPDHWGVYVSS